MKKLLPILLFLAILSCDNESNPDNCPQNLICTEQFEILTIELTENGEAILLSDYEILNLDNNNTYTYDEYWLSDEPGIYPVLSDGEMDEIQKEGTTLRLVGTLENGDAFEVEFMAGHDCCHVISISGPFS